MIRQGTIIWVRVADPTGGNQKCRSAVVLTTSEEIDGSSVERQRATFAAIKAATTKPEDEEDEEENEDE